MSSYSSYLAPPSFPTRRSSDLSSPGHAAFQEMVLAQSLGDADRQAPRDEKGDRGIGATVGRDHASHLGGRHRVPMEDRKSTRLNSSHRCISYAVFCLTKKNDKS